MVVLESLAGTGHKLIRLRPKVGEKLEEIAMDPYVFGVHIIVQLILLFKQSSAWESEIWPLCDQLHGSTKGTPY
ncbi:hypothetical protein BaRGS_00031292 [Batillaria attramentaria]|uniref:Uncharacterized protein n=1 Tax=Batillaria attramentaria TaxID=370345 RepID=A0ABD0JRK1_9CAEN